MSGKFGIIKIILIWIISVPIILLGYPTLSLLGFGMLPTIISFIAEDDIARPRTICIGAFNICGVVPYLFELWENRQSFQYIMMILKNPNAWMIMYGVCTIGYAIYIGVPKIVLGAMRLRAVLRIKDLKNYQEQIIEEWGEDVRPNKRFSKKE